MNNLTNEEILTVNSQVNAFGKSMLIAYLLFIFFGSFGAHRFYLGKIASGIVMLSLTLLGILTSIILVGFIPIIIVGIWCFFDIFLTYINVNKYNNKVREQAINSVLMRRQRY